MDGRSAGSADALIHCEVTTRCNLRCCFCCEKGVVREDWDVPFDVLEKELRARAAEGVRRIRFMRGESIMYRRMLDVVALCRDLGFQSIGIVTAGHFFADERLLRRYLDAGLDHVEFSLQSHRPDVADEIAGVAGTGERQHRALDNLAGLLPGRASLSFVTLTSADNHDHLLETFRWLEQRVGHLAPTYMLKYPLYEGAFERERARAVRFRDYRMDEVYRFLDERGRDWSTNHLPLCRVAGWEHRHRKARDLAERRHYLQWDWTTDTTFADRRYLFNSQVKGRRCRDCSLEPLCEGVQAGYAREHGFDEFVPSSQDPLRVLERMRALGAELGDDPADAWQRIRTRDRRGETPEGWETFVDESRLVPEPQALVDCSGPAGERVQVVVEHRRAGREAFRRTRSLDVRYLCEGGDPWQLPPARSLLEQIAAALAAADTEGCDTSSLPAFVRSALPDVAGWRIAVS